MAQAYIKDTTFEQEMYLEDPLPQGEYENCIFSSCIFTNSSLNGSQFTNCKFESCDLSMVSIVQTAFRGVSFKSCKMLALQFDTCNHFLLAVNFEECILHMANFYDVNLADSSFKRCSLIEVDFTQTNLAGVTLDACDCSGATFDHTNLKGADFSTAKGFIIDPGKNAVKGAKFSHEGLPGLLMSFGIEIV